jgi:lipoate-protein ligase A
MRFLDLTLPTLEENLALDEALLLEAEAGRFEEVLRFWEWSRPAVVLGAGCKLSQDVHEAECLRDRVPVVRRSSGGGTVVLGPGCLVYTLVLPYARAPSLREIGPSYRFILGRIREALTELIPGIEHAGTSDLVIGDLKFSGNAQQRKRRHLLHHGTVLYNFDLPIIDRYLSLPARQPEYRAGRDHRSFVTNLLVSAADLRSRLRVAWQANSEAELWSRLLVGQLIAEKYSQSSWNRRR